MDGSECGVGLIVQLKNRSGEHFSRCVSDQQGRASPRCYISAIGSNRAKALPEFYAATVLAAECAANLA
jgi:hypothetical protein